MYIYVHVCIYIYIYIHAQYNTTDYKPQSLLISPQTAQNSARTTNTTNKQNAKHAGRVPSAHGALPPACPSPCVHGPSSGLARAQRHLCRRAEIQGMQQSPTRRRGRQRLECMLCVRWGTLSLGRTQGRARPGRRLRGNVRGLQRFVARAGQHDYATQRVCPGQRRRPVRSVHAQRLCREFDQRNAVKQLQRGVSVRARGGRAGAQQYPRFPRDDGAVFGRGNRTRAEYMLVLAHHKLERGCVCGCGELRGGLVCACRASGRARRACRLDVQVRGRVWIFG